MKIGIIGAGGIGQAFAAQATRAGYQVILSNRRGPESLQEALQELGPNAIAGTTGQAVAADVLFISVTWDKLEQAIAALPSLEGKILIDATNPVLPGFKPADLGGKASSQVVSGWAKGARLVKAFNTYTPQLLSSPSRTGAGKRVILYSGDDAAAKEIVRNIITTMGFAPVDLGDLENGSRLQQFPGGVFPGLNLVLQD